MPTFISCETTSIWLLNADKPSCDLNAFTPALIHEKVTTDGSKRITVLIVSRLSRLAGLGVIWLRISVTRRADCAVWHAELSENRTQLCVHHSHDDNERFFDRAGARAIL